MEMRVRFLLLLAVACSALAGAASAQVAAPFLNPVPLFNAAPSNPAVLSWDVPSRLAAAYTSVKFEDALGASIGDGNVQGVLGQYVGETLALGAAGAKLDVDIAGGGKLIERFSTLQAALKVGEWLSIGLGQGVDKRSDPSGEQKSSEALAGLTLRLGSIFYLGAVSGTDTVGKGTAPPLVEGDRHLTRYGAGIRWVGPSAALHLEAFNEHRAGIVSPLPVESQTIRGGTLEMRLGRIGISYTTRDLQLIDETTGVLNMSQKIKTASLAYVPEHGLALSIGTARQAGTGGGPGKGTFSSIGAAWLF